MHRRGVQGSYRFKGRLQLGLAGAAGPGRAWWCIRLGCCAFGREVPAIGPLPLAHMTTVPVGVAQQTMLRQEGLQLGR